MYPMLMRAVAAPIGGGAAATLIAGILIALVAYLLALTPLICRRLGMAMGLYVLVSLLVPLSSNTLEGLGRYASVLFPAFMLAGSMTTQRAHEAIVIVSLVFRTLLICFFVTWNPIY